MKEYTITEDKSTLSIEMIKNFLNKHSYWGKDRTEEQIVRTIENSKCFGIFIGKEQIGFARAVTDYTTIFYLADVFIVPDYQKMGYGKKLIEHIVGHPQLRNLVGILFTQTAHSLYKQYGFSSEDKRITERIMVKFV